MNAEDLPTRTWILLKETQGRPAAEAATALALRLPQSSTLEVRYGSRVDPAESARRGHVVEKPDGTATHWLNEQQISEELFSELDAIFQRQRDRYCAQHGHDVPAPRCRRCGADAP